MTAHGQAIRFCVSRDGTRIAYAVSGNGPPLVRSVQWGTHLEMDWECSVWRPWLTALASRYTLVRFDARGCGLSDHDVADLSSPRHLEDLEAVVDACGLDRFALLGITGGAASAITYATRHPDRVSHLVLYGSYLRGRLSRSVTADAKDETETLIHLVKIGWGRTSPLYRQIYITQTIPDATAEQCKTFDHLLRTWASPENAAETLRAFHSDDVTNIAPGVRCPTLVLHARDEERVPFEQGRALAASIPGARLLPLQTRNHFVLEHEPAWRTLFQELDAFLPKRDVARFEGLTPREHAVLELVAQGLDNAQIAERLELQVKTVRNNVSNVMAKLGVRTRAAAIVAARDAGLGQ